jgi:hypothetical protein
MSIDKFHQIKDGQTADISAERASTPSQAGLLEGTASENSAAGSKEKK